MDEIVLINRANQPTTEGSLPITGSKIMSFWLFYLQRLCQLLFSGDSSILNVMFYVFTTGGDRSFTKNASCNLCIISYSTQNMHDNTLHYQSKERVKPIMALPVGEIKGAAAILMSGESAVTGAMYA